MLLLALLVTADTTRCPDCAPRRLGAAIGGMVASNLTVWSFNRFVTNQDWARVSPATWRRNWKLGFEFDPDQFVTNQFAHPYHGSLYFNAGRANGLSFWESAPLAIVGSLMWEYMGETFRPSLNDFFNTSLGGIALGEVTHRLAGLLRDHTATGAERIGREVAAGALDPVGLVTRWSAGQPGYRRGEPERAALRAARARPGTSGDRPPEPVYTIGQAGLARIANVGGSGETETASFVVVELRHGESFDLPYQRPWDRFVIRAEVHSGSRFDLAALHAQGRLFSVELGRRADMRHLLEVTQDYDYFRNPAYIYGAQSVAVSLRSRLGRGGRSEFLTEAGARVIVLGAINSDYADATGREYDYGPGFGLTLAGVWRHHHRDLLRVSYQVNWLHTVNGSDGDHFAQLAKVEGRLPVRNGLGVGMDALLYVQNSVYGRVPDVHQRHPQLRAYLAWFAQ